MNAEKIIEFRENAEKMTQCTENALKIIECRENALKIIHRDFIEGIFLKIPQMLKS